MLLLFDLDGTLVDSLQDLSDACNKAMLELGLPTYDYDTYKYFVGNGVTKLVLRALKKENEHLYDKARALFDTYYLDCCLNKTRPYEGMVHLLRNLKKEGYKIAVVTNKDDYLAKKICHYFFNNEIDIVIGHKDEFALKPNRQIVDYVLDQLNETSSHCIFIGDSDVDIYTGKNADMRAIGVTWGNRLESELRSAGADFIAKNVSELKGVIDNL